MNKQNEKINNIDDIKSRKKFDEFLTGLNFGKYYNPLNDLMNILNTFRDFENPFTTPSERIKEISKHRKRYRELIKDEPELFKFINNINYVMMTISITETNFYKNLSELAKKDFRNEIENTEFFYTKSLTKGKWKHLKQDIDKLYAKGLKIDDAIEYVMDNSNDKIVNIELTTKSRKNVIRNIKRSLYR